VEAQIIVDEWRTPLDEPIQQPWTDQQMMLGPGFEPESHITTRTLIKLINVTIAIDRQLQ
jgi:hypothetical protein